MLNGSDRTLTGIEQQEERGQRQEKHNFVLLDFRRETEYVNISESRAFLLSSRGYVKVESSCDFS